MATRNTTPGPRGPWATAAAGLLFGFVLALVVFAPATWLAARLEQETAGRVQLRDARGTVWNGSGRLVLTGGRGSKDELALPTPLDWRLRPSWNGVRLQIVTDCCTREPIDVRVQTGWRSTRVVVADAQTVWPAALLAGLGTPWNTLRFEGDLALSTQGLSVEWIEGRLAIAGRAELRAQRLSSRLTTLRPMGSYRITVLGGATPTLQLETLEGSLQLSGSGRWVGSRLRFTGEATAAPGREDALANLLNIIGRRSGPRSLISIG